MMNIDPADRRERRTRYAAKYKLQKSLDLGQSMKSILSTTSDSSSQSQSDGSSVPPSSLGRQEIFNKRQQSLKSFNESLKSIPSNGEYQWNGDEYNGSSEENSVSTHSYTHSTNEGLESTAEAGKVVAQGVMFDANTKIPSRPKSPIEEQGVTFMGWDEYSESNYSSVYSTSGDNGDNGVLEEDFPDKPAQSDVSVDEESQVSGVSKSSVISNEFDAKRPWRKPPVAPPPIPSKNATKPIDEKDVVTMNNSTYESSIDGHSSEHPSETTSAATSNRIDVQNRVTVKTANTTFPKNIHQYKRRKSEGTMSVKSDDDRQSTRSIMSCETSMTAGSEMTEMKVAKSALSQSAAALAGVSRDPYQALYAHDDEDKLHSDLSISPSLASKKSTKESYFALTGNVKPTFPPRQNAYTSDNFSYTDVAKPPKLSQANSFSSCSNETSSLSRYFNQNRPPNSRQSSRQSSLTGSRQSLMTSRHSLLSSRHSLLSRPSFSIVSSRQSSLMSSFAYSRQSTNISSRQTSSNMSSISSSIIPPSENEDIRITDGKEEDHNNEKKIPISAPQHVMFAPNLQIGPNTDGSLSSINHVDNTSIPTSLPTVESYPNSCSDDCSVLSGSSMVSFNSSMGSVMSIEERLTTNSRNPTSSALAPVTEGCDEGDGNDVERPDDASGAKEEKKIEIESVAQEITSNHEKEILLQKETEEEEKKEKEKKDKQVKFQKGEVIHTPCNLDGDNRNCRRRIKRLYQRMWDYKRGLGFALIATVVVIFASVLTLNFTTGSSGNDDPVASPPTRVIPPSIAPSSSSSESDSGSTKTDIEGKIRDRYIAPTPSPNDMATLWPTPEDTYTRPNSSFETNSAGSAEVDMQTRNRYITPAPSPEDTYLRMHHKRPVG